ncbi:hypothetical protein V2J09_023170 [Rumex salicifolius]
MCSCTVLGLEEGKQCIIVGTHYKHMKLKPCIFYKYSKEVGSYLILPAKFRNRRAIRIEKQFLHKCIRAEKRYIPDLCDDKNQERERTPFELQIPKFCGHKSSTIV